MQSERFMQVAAIVSGLTRTLSSGGQDGTHATLMKIYRAAWPRFLSLPEADTGFGDSASEVCTNTHMQQLLAGAADACLPPACSFEFFDGAAQEADLPPGLRFFFIVGATLARAAQHEDALGAGVDVDDTSVVTQFDAQALHSKYTQHQGQQGAIETLTMPSHLRSLLLERVWHAQTTCTSRVARERAAKLTGAVMMAFSEYLSDAPVLLESQRGEARVLAKQPAARRAVVAARLPVPGTNEVSSKSTYAHGFGLSVRAGTPLPGMPVSHLGTFVRVLGATDEQPKSVNVAFGVMADSDAALRVVVAGAVQWCRGASSDLSSIIAPQPHLWAMRASAGITVYTATGPTAGGWGFFEAFTTETCKALGYRVTSGEDLVVFACCEWPV